MYNQLVAVFGCILTLILKIPLFCTNYVHLNMMIKEENDGKCDRQRA